MAEAMEILHERCGSMDSHTSIDKEPPQKLPFPKYLTFDHFVSEIGNKMDSFSTISLENVRTMFMEALDSEVFNETQNFKAMLSKLKKRGYIYPGNLTNLRRIIWKIEDHDIQLTMMKEVNRYSKEQKAVYMAPPTEGHVHGYRRLHCEVKNANYYEYQTDELETLVHRISTITGIDVGNILLDGIQYTGNIHVTLLIPDKQYDLFRAMIAIQGEVDMNVDLITFNDGTTIEVPKGEAIGYPISSTSSREELHHLKQTTNRFQGQIAALERQLREHDKKFEEMTTARNVPRMQEPEKAECASGTKSKITMSGKTLSDENKKPKEDVDEIGESEMDPFSAIVKRGVTKQLEELFRTKGLKIDKENGGYKVEVVRRAMKTSGELSDKEIAIIEKSAKVKETEMTQQVRETKSLALLRLYYLENVGLPKITDIDEFMETHLKEVGRMDLLEQWNKKKKESMREGLLPGLGGLPGLGDLFETLVESTLKPVIRDLLSRVNSKLSKEDIDELKKRTNKNPDDKGILECLVRERQKETGDFVWGIDDLRTFLTEIFQGIGRPDLIDLLNFEVHKTALKTEVKTVLRSISRKLSNGEKEKIRETLDNPQVCEKDEELLEFYLWSKRGNDDESTLDALKECMQTLFRDLDNNNLYNELQTQLDNLGGFSEDLKAGVLRGLGLKLSEEDADAVKEKCQEVPEGLRKEEILSHLVKEKSSHGRWSVENLRNFIMDLLEDIGRTELLKYFDYAMHKAVLKNPVKAILRRFSGELSHDEKTHVRREVRNVMDLDDDSELLECYLWVKTKDDEDSGSTLDVLLKCMKELFETVGNGETFARLLKELLKINGGLKPEVLITLKETCEELSEDEKETLRSKLTDPDPDLEDDDILCRLVQQESRNKSWNMQDLKTFLRSTLSSDGYKIFEEKSSENESLLPGLAGLSGLPGLPGLSGLPGLAMLGNQLGGLLGNGNHDNEIQQRLDALTNRMNSLDQRVDQQQRGQIMKSTPLDYPD